MKNAFILFLVLVAGIRLMHAQNAMTEIWYIADAKIACNVNNTITSCLKVRSHPDSSWKDFSYEIEGFIFEPGVEVMAELLKTPIAYPEDNGPKYTYKLLRVVESRSTVLTDKRLLANNKWKIINLQDLVTVTPSRKAGAYIKFNLDSNTISGFTGCNQLSGNTRIEDGKLAFGIFNSTMMSCLNDEIEKKIREIMVGEASYYIRNNILFITGENHIVMHLKPEKRLDSLIAAIYRKPSIPEGNTYRMLADGNAIIKLELLPETRGEVMTFKKKTPSAEEKKTIKYKLSNLLPDATISAIHILKKSDKASGMSYAEVIFRDGTRKTILIKNVL